MSQKALSMRKIKEVLRLRYDLGLLQNEIARSCSIGQASVHRYLERASAAGLSWPLPEDWDDRQLNELLFPAAPAGGSAAARARASRCRSARPPPTTRGCSSRRCA